MMGYPNPVGRHRLQITRKLDPVEISVSYRLVDGNWDGGWVIFLTDGTEVHIWRERGSFWAQRRDESALGGPVMQELRLHDLLARIAGRYRQLLPPAENRQ